jgi:hypothetical protein
MERGKGGRGDRVTKETSTETRSTERKGRTKDKDNGDDENMSFLIATAATLTYLTTAEAFLLYITPYYSKITYHSSALTGAGWVLELLHGHPE